MLRPEFFPLHSHHARIRHQQHFHRVSEEQLIALKGIKKGTLKKAREKSFMEGREYKHVAHDGMPWDNSPCFYNLEEIDRWIERQASARPRRHLT